MNQQFEHIGNQTKQSAATVSALSAKVDDVQVQLQQLATTGQLSGTPDADDVVVCGDETRREQMDAQLIYGLSLEGCRWDQKVGGLADPYPKQLFAEMPAIRIKAQTVDSVERAATRVMSAQDYRANVVHLIMPQLEVLARKETCEKLQAELANMTIPKLLDRAVSDGVSERDLERAEEKADYKAAVIELLVRKTGAHAAEKMRAELSSLNVTQLLTRAKETHGVSAEQLEQASEHQSYIYDCPVYKTLKRAKGALGRPDGGYIFTAGLKTYHRDGLPSKWTLMGVALIADTAK